MQVHDKVKLALQCTRSVKLCRNLLLLFCCCTVLGSIRLSTR